MLDRAGRFIARHWVVIIVGWLLLAAGLHRFAPRWADITHDGDLAYLPERMPSVQGERLLAAAFPNQTAKSQIAILVERPDGVLTPDDLRLADRITEQVEKQRADLHVVDIWTRESEIVGNKLTSRAGRDGQATIILLQLSNEFMAVDNVRVLDHVLAMIRNEEATETYPKGLQLGVSGSAALGGDMLHSATESIHNTERTTIVLVVLILLLVYRAPVLVLIPLVTIGISFLVSIDLLAALTQLNRVEGFEWWHFKVFTTTKIFIVVILFGAGTDFCLFLISRFKEELEHGFSSAVAIARSVGSVGHALIGSAMTTICGLGMMYFSDFGKYRNSGPAIAICLFITLVACLTLAPALVRACGDKIFWPRKLTHSHDTLENSDAEIGQGFWAWASGVIMARPGLILVVSVLAMLPLAIEGLSVDVTYDLLNELQPTRPSVVGTKLARQHFSAGQLTPLTILAVQKDGHFDETEGENQIARLTKLLYEIDGVVSVRSIAEPLGDPPGYFQPFRPGGLKKLAARKHKVTEATYLTQVPDLVGKVARLDLVMRDEPFSRKAVDALYRLDRRLTQLSADKDSAWHDARFEFVGATVGVRDLEKVTQSDRTLIQRLTVLAVLAVLVVILQRPIVCLYLILSVLFSYYVTIGATELVFHYLYSDTFHGLDWKVPIFLFVILIAVGEDYNIYLVTRVNEEQLRHGPMKGLQLAVARTGGIITSCGIIMAGTFVSMLTGTLRGMLELGFALSLGVMLDTCVVRPILVPAFLALIDRRAGGQLPSKPEMKPTSKTPWMAAPS